MPPRSLQIILLMVVIALVPAASRAQPVTQAAAPEQSAAPSQSNSTLDVPIEEIAASPGGCAILDKDFPGLRTHAMYRSFRALSLNQVAAMSSGKITSGMLVQAQADLSALPPMPVASVPQQAGAHDPSTALSGNHASLR